MHIAIDIEIGNGGKGEIDVGVVGPEVDAVFAIIERRMHALGLYVDRFPTDKWQCVVDGVRHAGLYLPHQIGKGFVVVALEDVVEGVDGCCAAGAGKLVLMLGGLDYLHGGAGIHHLLETADADIGHVGHIVVEAQHDHAMRTALRVDNWHQALAIILSRRSVGCYSGVISC